MTDLEKHVNRPGRDKQVKRVREKIKEIKLLNVSRFNLNAKDELYALSSSPFPRS